MQNNHLPAGLMNDQIEFFTTSDSEIFCLSSGQRLSLNQFDQQIIDAVESAMLLNPQKLEAIHQMGITDPLGVINQFLVCNYGGFDNDADMIDGKLQATEYWACPNRGKCPHEGILCDNLKTDTGEILSKREIEITRLIAIGDQDKEIAYKLNLSRHTVAAHNRNIRIKTGLSRKPDITRFAIQKKLI